MWIFPISSLNLLKGFFGFGGYALRPETVKPTYHQLKPTNQPIDSDSQAEFSHRLAQLERAKSQQVGEAQREEMVGFHHVETLSQCFGTPAQVDGIVQKLGNLTQQVGGG